MARRLVCSLAVIVAGTLSCSSSSKIELADAAFDAHDAPVVVRHEGGIPDATAWEAAVPDAPLSVSDALPDVPVVVDPMNCVAPAAASNAAGVGGYCSPGGGQCNHDAPDAAPSICTADFGAAAHLWFCTVACASTADCGAGSARCVAAANGSVCVPTACAAFAADASVDAGDAGGLTDATLDAPVDARDAAPVDAPPVTDAPADGG